MRLGLTRATDGTRVYPVELCRSRSPLSPAHRALFHSIAVVHEPISSELAEHTQAVRVASPRRSERSASDLGAVEKALAAMPSLAADPTVTLVLATVQRDGRKRVSVVVPLPKRRHRAIPPDDLLPPSGLDCGLLHSRAVGRPRNFFDSPANPRYEHRRVRLLTHLLSFVERPSFVTRSRVEIRSITISPVGEYRHAMRQACGGSESPFAAKAPL